MAQQRSGKSGTSVPIVGDQSSISATESEELTWW